MTLICANCGTENLAGAKFCMECASPLASGCPSCGFVNLPNAKFCSECATPLIGGAAAAPRAVTATSGAERRLVSVLFADLVGFTPFAEERDAEDVRDTLTRYFDLSRELIERYGGTVEKFIGDAVMAVWGAPTAREDDAERAVRAGLDLVGAVRSLGPTIQARVAILTGEAAVTLGATNQGMVAGDLVNTAARLQGVAEPGTVLVGESTRRAALESIAFEELGHQALKGKSAPVAAWRALRVVAQRGGRGRSETLEAPFVGRDDEMRLLKELFHATNRERKPRLVSVIGPGGIGKSRLAWEFLKYIDGLTETVWWHDGRSPAYGEGITFWALGEMVRGRAGLLETDDEQTTREKLAATVRDNVPDESERANIERALLALLGFESGFDASQLFGAWRTFFERLAEVNPVVMVFEDLQFADPGLLDFIDHVQEWSRQSPITIITLARPELLDKRPNWGAGKRSFSSIYLEPLTAEQMRELLAGLVPGLPEKAAAAIIGRADGIPLYAVETVRMLLADGRLTLSDGAYRPTGELDDIAVPETLTALIAARLDGLEAADRSLVADAAVLGQSFSIDALSALSGVAQAELAGRLAALARRELVHQNVDPRSPELGQYVFVQALIREVAYNTLSKVDRKARHLAAARHLESLATDEAAGALASHYVAAHELAGEGPEAEALAAQARLALRGAAERAAALGSHEQAVSLYEQALTVTSDLAERADLLERAFASSEQGIDVQRDMRLAEAALAARRELGDRAAIARAAARVAYVVRSNLSDPDRGYELASQAWEEFSDLAETPEGLKVMEALGKNLAVIGRRTEALPLADRMITVAERLDLMEDLAIAVVFRGQLLLNMDRPREGMLLMRGGHAMALAGGFRTAEGSARVLLTFREQWGDPAEGVRLAREGFDIARQIGSTVYGWQMVGNGVVCAVRVGEWDWAAAVLEEWIPTAMSGAETPAQISEFYVDRAILTSVRGGDPSSDLELATATRGPITDTQYESYDAWARAWAAFSGERFDEARRLGLRAAELTDYFYPLAVPLAARSALWAADPAAARDALQRGHSMHRGDALSLDKRTIEAGAAALEGRAAEALTLYREVLRGWRDLGAAFDEALAVVDMVNFVGADEPDVRTAADRARATLTRLAAQPFLERLEAGIGRKVSTQVTRRASATQVAAAESPTG